MHERLTGARCGAFLTRLRHDIGGNTLAIVAAALVPLTAMIGSGIDMSRAYMAKTRMQSACDAAALAGRRVMQNDTLNATVTNEATRFFRYNFPIGLYQTASFNPVVTRPSAGTVRVTASTTIPTAIMRIFGFTSLPIDVTCDASLSYVNTDVMLVLDTTGSMDEDVNGNSTWNSADKKITGLRNAVMALYDELAPVQTQLQNAGLRLRYGIVPYSSTVNVGHLIAAVNPDYIVDSAEYQSRVARYEQLTYVGDPETTTGSQTYPSSISQSNCDRYGRNVSFTGFTPSATTGGGPAPSPSWTRSYSNNESAGTDWGWSGAGDTAGDNRSCRRHFTQIDTSYETRYRWSQTILRPEMVDVSSFKLGGAIQLADTGDTLSEWDGNVTNDGYVATPGTYDAHELATATTGGNHITSSSHSWNGCIIERETVSTINASSGYAIPTGALDLNINLIPDPDDDETRWRPFFPQATWRRAAGTATASTGTQISTQDVGFWACPTEARRLQAFNRGEMQSYVTQLQPVGGTYHDIGLIWGARMISNGGIFADSPDVFNGMPVARHLVFMTDGQLAPNCNSYTAYGIEQNDERITDSSSCSGQYERHLQRFRMMCNAIKGMNVSVWVIAFGTTLSADMASCASNANQASTASSQTALIQRFREIGSNIGALRLTQ
jgi:Flp pilus assembly protein TadG